MPPGRCHPADATQPCTRLKLSRAAGGSVSAPAVSRIMPWVEPRAKTNCQKNIGEMTFVGGIFNVVSLKYIGKRHLVITYTLK